MGFRKTLKLPNKVCTGLWGFWRNLKQFSTPFHFSVGWLRPIGGIFSPYLRPNRILLAKFCPRPPTRK
jgi:hypothetical protein